MGEFGREEREAHVELSGLAVTLETGHSISDTVVKVICWKSHVHKMGRGSRGTPMLRFLGAATTHNPKAAFGVFQCFLLWKDLFRRGMISFFQREKLSGVGKQGRGMVVKQMQASSQLCTFTESRNVKQMFCRKINHCPGSIIIGLWRIGFLRSKQITQ